VTREDIANEARAVAKLCREEITPFIVKVISHGWLPASNSYYYIDMEYCAETLETRIKKKSCYLIRSAKPLVDLSQLPPVIGIAANIALGLAYIHSQRVVHRDLKPNNSNH
jgi:serine/threonine protein kinase